MTMTTTDTLRRLPISSEDFLCLKGAVADRDRNLRLTLLQTDIGEDFIVVEVSRPPLFPGFPTEADAIIAHVIRGERGWMVHHPEDGPLYEFATLRGVAAFLGGEVKPEDASSQRVLIANQVGKATVERARLLARRCPR